MKKVPERRGAWEGFFGVAVVPTVVGFLVAAQPIKAQSDFSVLRINEVLADNESQPPADKTGAFQDLVEIYNSGDQTLSLSSLALSETPDADPPNDSHVKAFPSGTTIEPKGFVVVMFTGKKDTPGDCQTELNLGVTRDGAEPITLWAPVGSNGKRAILDQVWIPPLPTDVSFGRFPDGAGPAPVKVEETYEAFRFYPPGATSFGVCDTVCIASESPCKGAPNGPGGNIAPSVNRASHSSNHPAAGEAVNLVASVEDDKPPTPEAIRSVRIQYSLNGATQPDIEMAYDEASGVQKDSTGLRPLKRWTLWKGSIPGQPRDTKVEFKFVVEDKEGLIGQDPGVLCPRGVGPCDHLGLPGPDCLKAPDPSLQFLLCDVSFRYVVGYEPNEVLGGLVINEIMATQTKTIRDGLDYDDYVELYNGSEVAIDLAGLWLSDRPFQPQGWKFPDGSRIEAGAYLLVWTDDDGGQCPRPPSRLDDGQKCPDPTDSSLDSYHTNFALDSSRDQIYIFDRDENGHGVVHGFEFALQLPDVALALIPNGDRSGTFQAGPGSPGASNLPGVPFRRGDSNGDCGANLTDAIFTLRFLFQGGDTPKCKDAADTDDNGRVEITDAIYLLNYLFQGGPAIPLPGESVPGLDPTSDTLEACEGPGCT